MKEGALRLELPFVLSELNPSRLHRTIFELILNLGEKEGRYSHD